VPRTSPELPVCRIPIGMARTALLPPLLIIAGFLSAATEGAIKGPPTASQKDVTVVVRLGTNARIPCPMSGQPAPLINWSKGGESINSYSWERFGTSRKSLKIANVQKEDSGQYTCKGTNGFGSEEVTVNLVVIDPADFPNLAKGELPDVSVPTFTDETKSTKTSQRKAVGDTVRLPCEARGKPVPRVKWYRERGASRIEVSDSPTLVLKQITAANTGVYTCYAGNLVGVAVRNYTVTVDQLGPAGTGGPAQEKQPSLPGGPENTTVQQGDTARLECVVRSSSMPNIKWLKKIEYETTDSGTAVGKYPDIIDVGNEKFVVIQKSSSDDVVSTMQPGEYVNELEIPRAEVSDSGMYYCFVTNAFGFKYKNAYLEVVPVNVISQPTPTTTSTATSSSWDTGLTILVACLAIFVFILIAILVGYVIKKRFLDPKGASRSANSSAAIPTSEGSEVQENLMRNQNAYYEYQQQQHQQQQQQQQFKTAYSSSSGGGNNCNGGSQYNNNRNNGAHVSKMEPLPPPPPPPSETSSKYHQFQQGHFQQGQFQNQYEVPHVVSGGGSGRYAPPPSIYGGSSVVQQSPIYPYRSQQYGEYYD